MRNERSTRGKWVQITMAASMAVAMLGSTGAALASTLTSQQTAENNTLLKLVAQVSALHDELLQLPYRPGQTSSDQQVRTAETRLQGLGNSDWTNIIWHSSSSPATMTETHDLIQTIEQLAQLTTFSNFQQSTSSTNSEPMNRSLIQDLRADFAKLHQDGLNGNVPLVTGQDLDTVYENFRSYVASQVIDSVNHGTPLSRTQLFVDAMNDVDTSTTDANFYDLLKYFGIEPTGGVTTFGDVESRLLDKVDSSREAVNSLSLAYAMTMLKLSAGLNVGGNEVVPTVLQVGNASVNYKLIFNSDPTKLPASLAELSHLPLPAKWSSSDSSVVSINSDGTQATPLSAGSVILTAKYDGVPVYEVEVTAMASSTPASLVVPTDAAQLGTTADSVTKDSTVVYDQTTDGTSPVQATAPVATGAYATLSIPADAFGGKTTTVGITQSSVAVGGLASGLQSNGVIGVFFKDTNGHSVSPTKSVTLTITYPNAVPGGAQIYKITSSGPQLLPSSAWSASGGTLTISFSSDPYFVIAVPTPTGNNGGGTSTTTTGAGTGTSTTTTGTGIGTGSSTGTGTATGGSTPSLPNPLSKFPDASGVTGGLVNQMEDISFLADNGTIDTSGGTLTTTLKDGTQVTLTVPSDAFPVPVEAAISSDVSPILVNMDFAKDLLGGTSVHAIGVFFINPKTGEAVEPTIPVTLTVTNDNIPADGVVYSVGDSQLTKDAQAKLSDGGATITVSNGGYAVVTTAPAHKKSTTPPKPKTSGVPTYLWLLDNGKHVAKAPRTVIHKQVYVPIWYVEHALKKLGFTSKYEAKNHMLTFTSPKTLQAHVAKLEIGKGTVRIYVDGKLVKRSASAMQRDPYSGHMTTWMPMIPVEQALVHAQVKSEVKGPTWNFVTPTKKK